MNGGKASARELAQCVLDFDARLEAQLLRLVYDALVAARRQGCESPFESGGKQDALVTAPLRGAVIGAAVSGGADSVSLLVSMCHIARRYGFPVKAVTVNHNIREEKETAGDAESVMSLCDVLSHEGYDVSCTMKTIPRGEVERAARERGRGEEEAARYLRYKAFDEAAREEGINYIALAHNQNDLLETILMRFLTGGRASGIKDKRSGAYCTFIRPMLSIKRSEIEAYLLAQGIGYRTDSTNCSTRYLRNKIRHHIIDVLNSETPFWRKAVLTGAVAARYDEEALDSEAEAVQWRQAGEGVLSMRLDRFKEEKRAIKTRVLLRAFNELSINERVPYSFVSSVASEVEKIDCNACSKDCQKRMCQSYAGVSFSVEMADGVCTFYAKKMQSIVTDCGFCVIIEETGRYNTPLGMLDVAADSEDVYSKDDADGGGDGGVVCSHRRGGGMEDGAGYDGVRKVSMRLGSGVLCGVLLPLCVHSRAEADEVLTAEGKHKSVASVMSDWKVPRKERFRIPIVESGGNVLCVWGSVLGYKDYRVKGL